MHEMPSSHTANLSPCGPRRRCATLALLALLGGLVASGAHSAAAEPIASGMTLRAVAPDTLPKTEMKARRVFDQRGR